MPAELPSSPSVTETWLTADVVDVEPESSVPVSREQSLIGTTLLDTYVVDRALGEGGMGRIYDAHHRRIPEKRFAIKVLRPELLWSAQVRTRFERESAALARITHPSVLSIVDVGKTPGGLPFMVSEHLSGLDLLAYLRRFGRLPNERVIQLGCRLTEALEAIHAQGVIHRDVKPGNIFLLGAFAPLGPEWDRVKLIDFGLSRFSGGDDELTKNGIVMGTPAYMSPEQARGGRADHLTDVYGVGAVLYAAATGVAPFPEETPRDTLMAVLHREPVRPRTLNPAISEGLEIVIQRALSKRPEERQPSMSALRLELANLELASAGKRPVPRSTRALSLGGVRTRLVVVAAAALLLLLGAAANIAGSLGELGIDRRLELGERLLLLGLFGVMLLLLGLWLGRLDRQIWQNSARLAERLPRLEAPLFASIVVYGLGSFALRLLTERFVHGPGGLAVLAGPAAGASLSLCALVTALASVIANGWRPARAALRRALGAALAAGIVFFGAIAVRPRIASLRAEAAPADLHASKASAPVVVPAPPTEAKASALAASETQTPPPTAAPAREGRAAEPEPAIYQVAALPLRSDEAETTQPADGSDTADGVAPAAASSPAVKHRSHHHRSSSSHERGVLSSSEQ